MQPPALLRSSQRAARASAFALARGTTSACRFTLQWLAHTLCSLLAACQLSSNASDVPAPSSAQREILGCLHASDVDVLEQHVHAVNHPSTETVDAFVASYVFI